MTIQDNTTQSGPYVTDGVNTRFDYNYRIVDASNIDVILINSAGAEQVLDSVLYTVYGVGEQNGFVIMDSAPAAGQKIRIDVYPELDQPNPLGRQGAYSPETVEEMLDRTALMVRRADNKAEDGIRFPAGEKALTHVLPPASLRANKFPIFDASGNVTISAATYADVANSGLILSQAEAAADAALGYSEDANDYYQLTLAAPVIASADTVERFSGNGSNTGFTLSVEPLNEDNTQVFIDGVYQQKDTYSVSGTTLTFSEAPPAGTDNIEVTIKKGYAIGTPSDGTVSTAKVIDRAITFDKIEAIATDTVLGRDTAGDGSIEELTIGDRITITGGALTLPDGAGDTALYADDSVTFAKVQNISTNKLLGRYNSGSGNIEELGIGSGLTVSAGNLIATGAGTGDMLVSTYDAAGVAEQLVGLTASQTLTNKTLTSPTVTGGVFNDSVSGSAVLDEDNMTSNSATKLATQQSIKAYVDTGLATKAASSHTHVHSDVTDFDEAVEDIIGAKVIAGTDITVSYNDTTGETTIASTASGSTPSYKLEQASISTPPAAFAAQWGYKGTTETAAGNFPVQINAGSYTGTPTSGQYFYMEDLAPQRINFSNHAGYQGAFNSDADGRTMLPVSYIRGFHDGYGDCNAFTARLGIGRHASYASAARWTAFNSVTQIGGACGATSSHVNVYGAEFQLYDNNHATTSGIGLVLKLYRQNQTSDVDTIWSGVRVDSDYAAYADVAFQANGRFKNGLDFSGATLSTQSAMILRTDHRIVFNSSGINAPTDWYHNQHGNQPIQDYLTHDGSKYVFVANSSPTLQLSNSVMLYAPSGTSRFSVNTSLTEAAGEFKVSSSIGGSTHLRVQSSAITCNTSLDVSSSGRLNMSGTHTTASLVTSPTIAIKIYIDGMAYKVNAQAV